MRKQDLAKCLADKTSLSRSQAAEAVNAVFSIIENTLCSQDTICISGFGTFKVYPTKPRVGQNINKGTAVHIPPGIMVKLVVSKKLKQRLKTISIQDWEKHRRHTHKAKQE